MWAGSVNSKSRFSPNFNFGECLIIYIQPPHLICTGKYIVIVIAILELKVIQLSGRPTLTTVIVDDTVIASLLK